MTHCESWFSGARVSAHDQNIDVQTDALKAAGVERIFDDRIGGAGRKCPKLDQLIDWLRQGDVVVVTKYDRLARSLRDPLDIVAAIEKRGAGFRTLAEDIDAARSSGWRVFQVFAFIAPFERGRIGGRPAALSAAQKAEARRMRDVDGKSLAEIARLFDVSLSTVRRA